MTQHASEEILRDLGKLNPVIARNVKRVALLDAGSTSVAGANRSVTPALDATDIMPVQGRQS
jgi:hypothetical protein